VKLYEEKFELRLISPRTWEKMDSYSLEEAERVMSMRVCRLKHNATRSLRVYVVVGTGYARGEDEMAVGRILVFHIMMPHHLLINVSVRPEKAPIGAVVDVCGHLVACAGLKVFVFDFADGSVLAPCAFVDLEFFVLTADSLKNYVVLGDMLNGTHVFRWRDTRRDGRHLLLLSRDYSPMHVTAVGIVVDEPAITFTAFDDRGCVFNYQYQTHGNTRRGQRVQRGRAVLVLRDIQSCSRVA
jgi:cleavage and polyadenylation specificity factor subunit 1